MNDDPLRESRVTLDDILDGLCKVEQDLRRERAFNAVLAAQGRGLQVAQAHLQQAASILRGHVLSFRDYPDGRDAEGKERILK